MVRKRVTRGAKKVRRREDSERRFDWRFLVLGVILVAVTGAGVWLNSRFEGVSVGKFLNSLAVDDGDEKIEWGRYPKYEINLEEVTGGVLRIDKAGTYRLSGVLEDGMVYVDVKNTVAKLVLDNVVIRNSKGPAIYVSEGEDVVIEVIGENYVEDGARYEGVMGSSSGGGVSAIEEKTNGAIYSKQDLTFTGEGTLTVAGNYADGIVSKDDLKFVSGTYIITAADDGIRGTDSVRILGGKFLVSAEGDAVKATNGAVSGKGFVLVEGGELNLNARGKGVEAVETALIRGGKLKISAYEGIEARRVIIGGGSLEITAVDDGLNAKSDFGRECLIYIADGEVSVHSSGDGLDANGRILITGGEVEISVPMNVKNEALDADDGVEISEGVKVEIIER